MPNFQSTSDVISALRAAVKACEAAERKIFELVGTIDRLRHGGGELPEADPSASRSS